MGTFSEPLDVGQRLDSLVLRLIFLALHHLGDANDYAAGIEVVVEGLALAQELGAEQQIEFLHALLLVFHIQRAGIPHGDGTLDDHHGIGVHLQHSIDDGLHSRGVEEVLLRVIVRRGRNDYKLGIAVAGLLVEGGLEAEGPVGQIVLDVVVLDGRLLVVHEVNTLGDDIDSGDIIVLCQQSGDTETDIAGTCNGNFHITSFFIQSINF